MSTQPNFTVRALHIPSGYHVSVKSDKIRSQHATKLLAQQMLNICLQQNNIPTQPDEGFQIDIYIYSN